MVYTKQLSGFIKIRVIMVFKNKIDFIIINFYTIPFIELTVKSIFKYVDCSFKIYIINNGENEKVDSDYHKLKEIYKEEDSVVVLPGIEQKLIDPTSENDMRGFICKIDGRKVSIASKNKVLAQNIGIECGNGKYICLLDSDAVFLDKWIDKILPLLESNLFISHRWEPSIEIAREQFMIYKRNEMEQYNLQPNIHYKDCSGYLTYFCIQNNLNFKILDNSYNNSQLKSEHILDVPCGEQAFINKIPFLYHYGRGSTRDNTYVDIWIDKVTNYFNKTGKLTQ